jgi:hypothetical protein
MSLRSDLFINCMGFVDSKCRLVPVTFWLGRGGEAMDAFFLPFRVRFSALGEEQWYEQFLT